MKKENNSTEIWKNQSGPRLGRVGRNGGRIDRTQGGGPDECSGSCENGRPFTITGCSQFNNCLTCVMYRKKDSCKTDGLMNPDDAVRGFAGGGFRRDRIGGTGQPARFANQSGNGGGKILGLTTQQALIAIGVGVAAYFIIKKVK